MPRNSAQNPQTLFPRALVMQYIQRCGIGVWFTRLGDSPGDGSDSPGDSPRRGQDNNHTPSDSESSDSTYQPRSGNHRNRSTSPSSTSESRHRQRRVPHFRVEKCHRHSRPSLYFKKRLQVHTSPSSSEILSSSSSSSSSPADRRHMRRRRHSSSSSSSPSSTSSSSSTPSHSPRRHRHSHYRRRHCTQQRHRRSRGTHGQQDAIACAPPLTHRLTERIRKGKYLDFNKLLLPVDTPPLLQPLKVPKRTKDKSAKRSVIDLPTWLEAWNRFLCAFLVHYPSQALELAKSQTIIAMFFTNHPASQCIEYDRLFHQAAAKDRTIRWDSIKEDIYVWSLMRRSQPFRDNTKIPIAARL